MSLLQWARTSQTLWCVVVTVMVIVTEVMTLSGPNVCMVQQKYNITKRVKYRAPMSVRTYEWCFSMPPRCSKWSTEMRDLTRLETEERTAEVAVCCPGYKMKDISCVPICPSGKMGHGCSDDCPPDKWGPNCVNECPECLNGFCVPSTGECDCEEGWQGESCEVSMSTIQAAPALMEELLTTTKSTTITLPTTKQTIQTTKINLSELTTNKPSTVTTVTKLTTMATTSTQKTEITPTLLSSLLTRPASFLLLSNTTTTIVTTEWSEPTTTEKPRKITVNNFIYNRTETSEEGTSNNFSTEHVTKMEVQTTAKSSMTPLTLSTTTNAIISASTTTTSPTTTTSLTTTQPPSTSTILIPSTKKMTSVNTTGTNIPNITVLLTTEDVKKETMKMPETTTRNHFTTIKFKPKEIWIRPTQKGDPTSVETKIKSTHELGHTKLKSATNKIESTSENTTPKTIIVSIIPTSVSHATFKKIALTTALYLTQKSNTTIKLTNRTEQGFTKSMPPQVSTAAPFTIKLLSTFNTKNLSSAKASTRFLQRNTTLKVTPPTNKVYGNTNMIEKHINTTKAILNTTLATSLTTNSMLSTLNAVSKKQNSSTFLTTKPTNKQHIHKNSFFDITTVSVITKKPKLFIRNEAINKKIHTNRTASVEIAKTKSQEKQHKIIGDDDSKATNTKRNITKTNLNPVTTQEPPEDETFHILTEPEHITAVMNDKERDHTSVDLISVIGIAGGVMMAVITVAVIIVMIERCKRPRYDDVRKINDIRMQVMIDNSEVPPPYVRSIFHTPLPDPPTSDRCHYQPISTLDRNLKQFMRPVVVQTISPVMLENFRGILECHYDHLPRRNHDFGTMPTRYSVSPSMKCSDELSRQRPLSVADYTIEALKCEAKMDMIDNTTSEPLYAEIPCWRPPSEHAIEVLNLNGEAVTEL